MKDTKYMKKMRACSIIFTIISYLCVFGPMMVYLCIGWEKATDTQKVCLTGSAVACLVILVINVLLKKKLTSILWILVLALYYVLRDIQALLIITAILSIANELCFEPLSKYFRKKFGECKTSKKMLTESMPQIIEAVKNSN